MPHLRTVLALGVAVLLSSCAVEDSVYDPRPQPVGHGFIIPPGHMPPPGECRIWFPDLPPGQQPPPRDCSELQRPIPRGAVLVRGS